MTTVFGPITVERMAYRTPGAANLYPADAEWNTPAGLHSPVCPRLAVIEAMRGSFDQAGRGCGGRPVWRWANGSSSSDGRARRWTWRVSTPRTGRDPTGPGTLLVITADAKGVTMLPDALRQATAKAAAADTAAAARFDPPQRGNRMRMAEIACVYDIDPHPRTPSDVLPRRDPDPNLGCRRRAPRPKARGKWLTGSIADPAASVIAAAFDEADRRDADHERTWVALVDGNAHQLDVIRAEAAKRGVEVPVVIDFVHVSEYIWDAARVFFRGRPAGEAEAWVRDRLAAILAGAAVEVAAGIRRRATRAGLSGNDRTTIDTTARYLADKPAYLRYDQALANGWPIATGVIEGACRHLVGDRLGITGARWGLTGAEAILLLRAVVSNGDFDEYWAYHLRQEHQRNHLTKYRQSQSEWALAG